MTLLVADEVRMAVDASGAVVALETSVIGQGLPFPRNLECLDRMDGAIRVGLDRAELERIAEPGVATKVARRDLPIAAASGAVGATTVSATIWSAHQAGIAISATGGIGGVHRGAANDVSADLFELARTPVLLVCSGPKSVVDPAATIEKLEELGVVVVGYGVDRLPFFLARETAVALEHRADTPEDLAGLARAQDTTGSDAAILVCNPIARDHALDADEVLAATDRAHARMLRDGVVGKAVTPYLLRSLSEETRGRSLEANLVLLEDNARLAGRVAAALSAARSGR